MKYPEPKETKRTTIEIIRKILKPPIKIIKKIIRTIEYYIIYSGKRLYCPVCEKHSRKFKRYGIIPRDNARCFICGSLERHRLVWLYFTKKTNLFDEKPKKVLHIAPEYCFEKKLRKRIGVGYLTADIKGTKVMVKMDITNINYPDESFDVIYCSHVLEHIEDDINAIRELHRILKRNGWAVLMVPIKGDKTFEDPSINYPDERLKVFGQKDHVRIYGKDFAERLKRGGFKVKEIAPSDFLTTDEISKMAIRGKIYYCTK